VAGHRADAADGQAVVTAQQDGQVALLQLGMHRVVHGWFQATTSARWR
jgi:hypothetical protein